MKTKIPSLDEEGVGGGWKPWTEPPQSLLR